MSPSKRMVALLAYEELTLKETLCLKEENYDGLLRTQSKKAKLLDGLAKLNDVPLAAGEATRYAELLQALQQQESANAELLAKRMQTNRSQLRGLTRSGNSGVSALKAYGRPDNPPLDRSANLKDRA